MTNKQPRLHTQGKLLSKYKWLLIAAVLIVIFGVLELTNTINFFESSPTSTTISSQPREDAKDKDVESTPSESTPAPSDKQDSQPPTPSGEAPLTPYGSFVSNHHPNLDGDPAPSKLVSICNTTPGASCYMEFTNQDGVVKKLTAQTTDGNGTAAWQWDVKESGFTVGTWGVKAVATLNGKTTTAKDIQNIEVGP